MANLPFRTRIGFGAIDGYASDAAYLSATGNTPQAGDFYYNTATSGFRFYNGSSWSNIGGGGSTSIVRFIDYSFSSVPSGPQTIDGFSTNPGDLVILANFNGGAYQVQAGTWTAYPLFNGSNLPAAGAIVFVTTGTVYSNTFQWYDGTIWHVLNLVQEATATGAIATWSGTRYVADNTLLVSSASLSTQPNNVSDSSQGTSITLQGGAKTAGTGNGGNAVVSGGTSFGGNTGKVLLSGYTLGLSFPLASDPVSGMTTGDVYYNSVSNQFKYYNGTTWQPIGSSGGFVAVDLYDPVDTTLTTGAPVTIDGVVVTNGQVVLYSNLSSGNNEAYLATVVAGNVTAWTVQPIFSGLSTPVITNTVIVRYGNAFANQVGEFNGTTWRFNYYVRYFNGANYFEQSSLNTATLTDNSTGNVFSIGYAGSQNIIVDYSIIRGSAKETGTIWLTTDGTNVAISTGGSSIISTGVSFTGAISGSNIVLGYVTTSTGSSATMMYTVRRWSDTTGGPAGPPSYSGGGGGGGTAAGSNGNIQFNSSGLLAGNSNFNINTSLMAMTFGSAFQSILFTAGISDNQSVPTTLFTLPSSYTSAIVEYSISRGVNTRVGRLLIASNGTAATIDDDYTEQGDAGVTLTVNFSGGTEIQYMSTSTGISGTFSYEMRYWTA